MSPQTYNTIDLVMVTSISVAIILLIIVSTMALYTRIRLSKYKLNKVYAGNGISPPRNVERLSALYAQSIKSLPEDVKTILMTFVVGSYNQPLSNSIAANATILLHEESIEALAIIRILEYIAINGSPELLLDTQNYGRYLAALHGIKLDDFDSDYKFATEIERPTLLLSALIILMSTEGIIPTKNALTIKIEEDKE